MATITIGTHAATIPQSWNDLSLEQALKVYSIIQDGRLLAGAGRTNIGNKQLFLLLKALLGDRQVNDWHRDCITAYGKEDGPAVFVEEAMAVISQYEPLFKRIPTDDIDDDEFILDFTLSLTRCPYPVLSGDGIKLHAPADEFENVTIYELSYIFTLYESYVGGNAAACIELLATMYRPAKADTKANRLSDYQGDIRLPLRAHESTVAARKKFIESLPHQVVGLLLLWIASCRHDIVSQYPNLFKPKDELQTANSEVVSKAGNDYSWAGILMSLSDGLANLNAVADQRWSNAFIYMSMLEDQRKLAEFKAMKK